MAAAAKLRMAPGSIWGMALAIFAAAAFTVYLMDLRWMQWRDVVAEDQVHHMRHEEELRASTPADLILAAGTISSWTEAESCRGSWKQWCPPFGTEYLCTCSGWEPCPRPARTSSSCIGNNLYQTLLLLHILQLLHLPG